MALARKWSHRPDKRTAASIRPDVPEQKKSAISSLGSFAWPLHNRSEPFQRGVEIGEYNEASDMTPLSILDAGEAIAELL